MTGIQTNTASSVPSESDFANSATKVMAVKDVFIKNRDVLFEIFSLFLPPTTMDGLSTTYKKDLLSISLVCKGFCEPALDCLWSHLDSLTPLLSLHPALQVIDGAYFFLEANSDDKLSRFTASARRVRSISLKSSDKEKTHPISLTGMAWLGQQCRDTPLMPGLRKITFEDPKSDSVHMALLPLIISPSLKEVVFSGAFLSSDAFNSYALPLICCTVPFVRHLALNDANTVSHPAIWYSLPTLLAQVRLETLAIEFPNNPTLTPSFLSQIGLKMDSLTSLTLDVHTASHTPSANVVGQVLLLNLSTLHLINRSACKLCLCYPPFLVQRATTVTFDVPENILDATAFSEAIDIMASVQSLREVVIRATAHTIDSSVVIPFLRDLNLESFLVKAEYLRIGGPSGQEVKDFLDAARLGKDTRQTSSLRSLSIPIKRLNAASRSERAPSLDTLVYLSATCPDIRHIALSVTSNAVGGGEGWTIDTLIADFKAAQGPSSVLSKLAHLEIADLRPKDAPFKPAEYRDIARILDTIFPNLRSLSMINHPDRGTTWDEHWKLIDDYRQMRKMLRITGVNVA